MRIKKTQDGNQYLLTKQGMWVRNFYKNIVPYVDINKTITTDDHFVFLKNEVQNSLKKSTWIDSEKFNANKILIISDGYDFKRKHKLLANLPKEVVIMGVNGSLAKWELNNKVISYYVVNNPYQECVKYLPKNNKISPKCLASIRTNYEFMDNYRGAKFKYCPVNESSYSTLGVKEVTWQIDDYRNPICAAIGLAYKFGAEKLMLFCCDDAFMDERPGAIQLENKLWIYPQQEIAHGLIDANLYWFKNQPYKEVSIGNCSSGQRYENATYIDEDKIISFWD